MNICHLTINTIDFERRIKNQVKSSAKSGDTVWVVALGKSGEALEDRNDTYYLRRIKTPFYKGGPLKFLHYNIKVFFFLLTKPLEFLHCHDLWTIPAALMLSPIKRIKLIYDAHEYFPGLEIFNKNKFRKKIWMLVERLAIKHVSILLTVSEPIAQLYKHNYPNLKRIEVIRNLPKMELPPYEPIHSILPKTDKKIVLYQGHFRPGRGLLQLIEAMSLVEEAHLVLIGGGELEQEILQKADKLKIKDRITFVGYVPTDQLISTAAHADLGIVLFEPTSLNYAYALPNKFFEYIMAGIPVLSSNLETFQHYINKYKTGLTVDPDNIRAIAKTINFMISDEEKLKQWKENARKASEELNWENESLKMNQIYEEIRN